jgi:tetratricopeptide (TPR) repeat protein
VKSLDLVPKLVKSSSLFIFYYIIKSLISARFRMQKLVITWNCEYPRFVVAYQILGSAYYSKGDYKKSISDYDKAIYLYSENIVTRSSRGNGYFKQGQIDDALSDYNKALELNPEIGKNNGGQEIVCPRIAPLGSIIENKIFLTKAQWAVKDMGQGLSNNKTWTYEDFLFNINLYE